MNGGIAVHSQDEGKPGNHAHMTHEAHHLMEQDTTMTPQVKPVASTHMSHAHNMGDVHQHEQQPVEHDTMPPGHNHQNQHASNPDHHAMMVEDFKHRFNLSVLLTIPILILSPMIQMFMGVNWRFIGDSYLLFLLATILFVYAGLPFITGARDELKQRNPAMMTLIALAITVAYVYSTMTVFILHGMDFFWELATLIVIMLLGHWIEMKSVMGASKALEELVKLMPDQAHLLTITGETVDRPVKDLQSGNQVLVKPGEKIPIDGLVFDGRSAVNEALITGESVPVTKQAGDQVIGGSVNGEGSLKLTVNKIGSETYLAQIITMVREAQQSRSNTQRLADIAAKWLFYIAVLASTTTFIVWLSRGDLSFALERAVTVIVICCPHALGLATPLVTAVSTSIAAQQGLLIRNRANFENARSLDAIVFDKTGTLTEGEFGITDVRPVGLTREELLTIAYAVESESEHPLAKAIVKESKQLNLPLKEVKEFVNLTGQGLQAIVDGRLIMIVSPGYMKTEKIQFDEQDYEALAQQGKTVIFIIAGSQLLGYIALTDRLRETSRQALEILQQMKVEPYMITGDNQRVAAYVADQLNIKQVFAEVLPHEKALKIDEIHRIRKNVAMVGDGVNDAPALARADLGIAIGAGTDVAIETADIILVRSNPMDVVNILKLSRATYNKMVQNLLWATGYNVIALPLAAGLFYNQGIVISPAVGAVLMSLSTVIVAMNARLLRIQ